MGTKLTPNLKAVLETLLLYYRSIHNPNKIIKRRIFMFNSILTHGYHMLPLQLQDEYAEEADNLLRLGKVK